MQNILCIILVLTEIKAKEKSDNRAFQVSPGILFIRMRVFSEGEVQRSRIRVTR